MRKRRNNYIVIILIIGLLALGIGYAALGGALNITGTAKTGTFEVKFTNTDTGSISSDGQTLSVGDIILGYPGDSKTITATVKNSGSLDAAVNSFSIAKTGATADQDAVTIAITPSSSFALNAGATQSVVITATWNSGSTSTLTGTVGFTATANYSQTI